MDRKLIEEINRLAKKQRTEGLTEAERLRQQEVRARYLQEFKANFRRMLEQIEVTDEPEVQ